MSPCSSRPAFTAIQSVSPFSAGRFCNGKSGFAKQMQAKGGTMAAIEGFGLFAIIIMVTSYALEKRAPVFIAIFAFGCAMAAFYAWMINSYPFLIAEALWAVIALKRWRDTR
jgi:hypothetical protein